MATAVCSDARNRAASTANTDADNGLVDSVTDTDANASPVGLSQGGNDASNDSHDNNNDGDDGHDNSGDDGEDDSEYDDEDVEGDESDEDGNDVYLVQCNVDESTPAAPIYLIQPTWVGVAHLVGESTRLRSMPAQCTDAAWGGQYMVDLPVLPTAIDVAGVAGGARDLSCSFTIVMDIGATMCVFASAHAECAVEKDGTFSVSAPVLHHHPPRTYFPRNPYALHIAMSSSTTDAPISHATFTQITLTYANRPSCDFSRTP